jgi:hypothetical protein
LRLSVTDQNIVYDQASKTIVREQEPALQSSDDGPALASRKSSPQLEPLDVYVAWQLPGTTFPPPLGSFPCHILVNPFDVRLQDIHRSSGQFPFIVSESPINELSTVSPAVTLVDLGESIEKGVYIAWKGKGNNNLNVMNISNDDKLTKVTLPETSPTSPALAYDGDRLHIAWKGDAITTLILHLCILQ